MRKKTTSQIICENFKIPSQIIFQDYKCTFRSSVTFFGRIYIGEEHFLFIANMFGIVKKCTIVINNITKIDEFSSGGIVIGENQDGHEVQYTFASFKNDNAYKLMRALWKGQKIGSDVLKSHHQEEMEVSDIEGMKNRESRHILDEGQVEANFFNPQSLESQKQKMVEVQLPCSVEQYYQFFLADGADVYSRKKHLEKRGSNTIVVTEWKKNNELNSEVREVTAMVKVTGVPFLNYAGMSQVCMLKKDEQKKEINLDIVTEMADVPYCTYFNCEQQVKIVSEGQKKCKMTIWSSIIFNKSTYMKNTIITKTFADFKDEYELWIKNVKQILEEMKKKRESMGEKSKKVQVQYEQNLPFTDKTIPINVQEKGKEKPQSRPLTLQNKVDLLIKMVALLLLINFVQIMYKIIF